METLTPKRNDTFETEEGKPQPTDVEAAEQNYQRVLNEQPAWKSESYRSAPEQLDAADAATNKYEIGHIPQRLDRESTLKIEPFSKVQLERLYNLSKSSLLEAQQQFNDELRDQPQQRMTQFAEYLAARDQPEADRSFSGELPLSSEAEIPLGEIAAGSKKDAESTSREKTVKEQPELTQAQLEEAYSLSMSDSNEQIETFKHRLNEFTPEQSEQFNAYRATRILETAKSEAESKPEKSYVEPLLQKEGQSMLSYFQDVYTAWRGDETERMRASQAMKRMNEDDRFKYNLYINQQVELENARSQPASVEKLEEVAALGRSINPAEQAQYGKELEKLTSKDLEELNKRRFADQKTNTTFAREDPPKPGLWQRIFRRKRTRQ